MTSGQKSISFSMKVIIFKEEYMAKEEQKTLLGSDNFEMMIFLSFIETKFLLSVMN